MTLDLMTIKAYNLQNSPATLQRTFKLEFPGLSLKGKRCLFHSFVTALANAGYTIRNNAYAKEQMVTTPWKLQIPGLTL